MLCISDYPIHQPATEGNAYMCDMIEDAGYILQMKDGVCQVYQDSQAAQNDQPFEWPAPDRNMFVEDHMILFALMTDGPL